MTKAETELLEATIKFALRDVSSVEFHLVGDYEEFDDDDLDQEEAITQLAKHIAQQLEKSGYRI